MKKIIIAVVLFISLQLNAQTGIGTATPDASAKLEVAASDKGFLPPRVTLTSATDNSTISTPAEGLLVYNKGSVGLQAGYYYWNGTSWATIATATSAGNGVTSTDLVKLYSKAYSTASGDIAHSGGFVFTVPVSGRYLFDFSSTGFGGVPGTMTFKVRQGTTDLGTDAQSSYNNNVHVEYNGKVEVNLLANTSYNVQVTTNANRDLGDYDRVYYKMVAGNLPVTGQSVDYAQASLSANQALSAAGNINFTTLTGAGITLTSGGFNLVANKTYKLEAAIGGTSGGYAYYGWVDSTNALLPGGSIGTVMKAGASYSDAPQDKSVVFYTPTSNTTVYLRVLSVSGGVTAYAPNVGSNYSSTWATIQQVGSSAIVNPWVLSGTNVFNTTGNVGIGTSSPNASAVLDVSSSSKGLLPPRVALTGKSGTSTPIASPATGLVVYNTATAGTADNLVIPGFYYFNGTIWTRMDNDGWSSPSTISITAVTTAPTKGTVVYDKVRYRRTSETSYEVTYNYAQSTPGTAGSGDYLFSLPSGLSFGSSVLTTNSSIYETVINRAIIGNGVYGDAGGRLRPIAIVPYNSTKFRIVVMDNSFGGQLVGASGLPFSTDGLSFKFSFILDTD